jgi:hypothetical protein
MFYTAFNLRQFDLEMSEPYAGPAYVKMGLM